MDHENHGDDTIIPTSAPVLPDSIPSDHLTCMQILPEDYVKEHGIPAGNTVPCLPDKSKPSWHATFQTRTKWENGRQLTVKFLGASPHPSDTVKNKVKQYALLWEKYANIKFVFVESGNADIRVSFNRKGSWSFIGKDCLNITDQSQPTMNFGWLDDSTSEAEYQRVVCHEFGHALGASHEQQNPNVHIDWNKPAVYEYYAKPENGGWSQQTTDINMFTPVVGAEATQWDPTSIMQYRILPGWTFDGFSVGVNGVISAQDASFMQTMYPQFQDDQGTWNTLSTGSIQQPSYQATIMYNPPKTNLPWLGLGINYIDHLILDPVAVSVWADDQSTAGFDLHIDGYPTTIFAAGATWLEFDPTEFPNVEVNSVGFSYPSPAPRENQFHVAFRHTYTNPPRVFVWLNSFAIEQGKSWCMGADVSDITKTGCTISISTLTADTGMFIGNVTYLVYPADMAGIETGIVKVGDPGTGGGPAHIQPQTNERPVTFQTAFRSRPKVFMAITALDFQNNFNMRLDTYVDNVSEEGFTAHMNSWIDNSMYGVTCSWIALKS